MNLFIPKYVYINPKIEINPQLQDILDFLKNNGSEIIFSKTVAIDGDSDQKIFFNSKKTVFFTKSSQKKLQSCKPSADYQFALSSSCPGICEYCYLQTTQGEKPFIKIFVNIDDILSVISMHIDKKPNEITTFECGSITDPVGLNHLSHNLEKCIEFFGNSELGKLRVITKYDNVDPFLNLNHNGNTKFRFSINTSYVISKFEHNTSSFEERIIASKKIVTAGYPIGYIIAPIMIYDNWKEDYEKLINTIKEELNGYTGKISFELIQHRYTLSAKELILKRFPNTKLEMIEEKRTLKWVTKLLQQI